MPLTLSVSGSSLTGNGAAAIKLIPQPAEHTAALFCFVIPTYNEAANIKPLLTRLTALYPEAAAAFLIVDDTSPDGTGNLTREFAETDNRVHLLEGRKAGLGRAYARGLLYALEQLDAEVVVCMDGDFQHDPEDARRLLARIENGADLVVGSRYVAGGGVAADWQGVRHRLSRWGNRLARRLTGVREIQDCTGGFRAIRGETLRRAGISSPTVRGYAFQIVLLHRLLRAGAVAVEEPVIFHARERGKSKLGLRDLLEFCYWALRLRWSSGSP